MTHTTGNLVKSRSLPKEVPANAQLLRSKRERTR